LVIFTTDHGTYNGSYRRTGKMQTHLHSPIAQIPLIVCHPTIGHGERRDQLVQMVDCYPTILEALGEPVPEGLHGRSLLPIVEDASSAGHEVAVCGVFGEGMTVTDGRWVLHVPPVDGNQPLYWYSHHLSRFFGHDLGSYECLPDGGGWRPAAHVPRERETWLSDLERDPYEYENVAADHPEQVRQLATTLRTRLEGIGAPPEQLERLRL